MWTRPIARLYCKLFIETIIFLFTGGWWYFSLLFFLLQLILFSSLYLSLAFWLWIGCVGLLFRFYLFTCFYIGMSAGRISISYSFSSSLVCACLWFVCYVFACKWAISLRIWFLFELILRSFGCFLHWKWHGWHGWASETI